MYVDVNHVESMYKQLRNSLNRFDKATELQSEPKSQSSQQMSSDVVDNVMQRMSAYLNEVSIVCNLHVWMNVCMYVYNVSMYIYMYVCMYMYVCRYLIEMKCIKAFEIVC